MKLRDYLNVLNQLVKLYPDILTRECVTSSDEEGNWFSIVHYGPSLGSFEDGEFDTNSSAHPMKVICLN